MRKTGVGTDRAFLVYLKVYQENAQKFIEEEDGGAIKGGKFSEKKKMPKRNKDQNNEFSKTKKKEARKQTERERE